MNKLQQLEAIYKVLSGVSWFDETEVFEDRGVVCLKSNIQCWVPCLPDQYEAAAAHARELGKSLGLNGSIIVHGECNDYLVSQIFHTITLAPSKQDSVIVWFSDVKAELTKNSAIFMMCDGIDFARTLERWMKGDPQAIMQWDE